MQAKMCHTKASTTKQAVCHAINGMCCPKCNEECKELEEWQRHTAIHRMGVSENEYGGWVGQRWWEGNDEMAQGAEGETGERSIWLNKRHRHHTLTTMGPPPFMQNLQRPAKRPCAEDDGGHSTNTSAGTEGAYGMSRAETDELTIRVAQMVSIHDQRLRELETVVLRKVIIPRDGQIREELFSTAIRNGRRTESRIARGPWGASTSG